MLLLSDGMVVPSTFGFGLWYGMVEVCEGAPVAMGGWVLADRHDVPTVPTKTRLESSIKKFHPHSMCAYRRVVLVVVVPTYE